MQAMAQYYAALDSGELSGDADAGDDSRGLQDASDEDAAAIARGAWLAGHGAPERRIPSCVACHGPDAAARNPLYPRLAGQYPDYLALQLTLFKHDNAAAPITRTS